MKRIAFFLLLFPFLSHAQIGTTYDMNKTLMDSIRGNQSVTSVLYYTGFLTAATTASPPFVGAAVSSGTVAVNTTNQTSERAGVLRLTSSTTANGGYKWQTDVTTYRIHAGDVFECAIAPVNFSTTTFRAGFLDATTSADAVDGVYFEYNTSGALLLKTSNNSTRTTSSTITTLSLNTWYKLRITINSDATIVYCDVFDASGAFIAGTSINTNIPTTAGRECGIGVIATESTTTATAMVDID
ncbi:MAG: hypothetical protein KGO82_16460, partial [Bacteroidota bacterium]|nr:hypothetical protein [Bacteroidota bacterium]